MDTPTPFQGRPFEADILVLGIRWSLRYSLRYRDREESMQERGLHVDHTTLSRWVQRSAPELERRCRPHLKACNDSWKVDETSIPIKNVWVSLSGAVDAEGKTLEVLLSPTRDTEAATRFFLNALGSSGAQARLIEEKMTQPPVPQDAQASTLAPRGIKVEKNAASPKAIADLKASGSLPAWVELRQVKDVNTLIEHDHRFITRLVKPAMGCFSFETAWRTLQGDEVMRMIRKGQGQGVEKGDSPGQAAFMAQRFGIAISTPENGKLHPS